MPSRPGRWPGQGRHSVTVPTGASYPTSWRPGASSRRRRLGGRLRRNQDEHGCRTAGERDRPRGARFIAKAGRLRRPPFGAHPWVATWVPAASLKEGGGVPRGCRAQALRFIESAGPGIQTAVQPGRKKIPNNSADPGRETRRPAGRRRKAEIRTEQLEAVCGAAPLSLNAAPVSATDQVEQAFSDSPFTALGT